MAQDRGVPNMSKETLTRKAVVQTLADALRLLDYVHAFWEGGAAALDRVDEWSDIDLYVVVEDGKGKEAFTVVDKALKSLSPIKQKYEIPQLPWPGVSQAFYRLEGASEYLIIDLAVLEHSSPDKFLEPRIHGDVVFYFNKSNKVSIPRLDRNLLVSKLCERLMRLKARFEMFNSFVQKEINRGNDLEAIDLYHVITLASLVEALRIKYSPFHHDFKMRYVHYELPRDIIQKLRHLYFVSDGQSLREKYGEATRWFHELMLQIDRKEIERLIRTS